MLPFNLRGRPFIVFIMVFEMCYFPQTEPGADLRSRFDGVYCGYGCVFKFNKDCTVATMKIIFP